MQRFHAAICYIAGLAFGLVICLPAFSQDAPAVQPPKVRLPAVQGQFYPAERAELARQVDTFLAAAPARKFSGRPRALIAPHAGFVYSGAVAGQVFSQVPESTRRAVILAPAHRVDLRGGGSILDVAAYRNAIGDVPLDQAAAAALRRLPFFRSVPEAHAREHSLEIMLPFLQRRLQNFTIVPIVLGQAFSPAQVAEAISPLLDDPGTILVVSSDLSHYHPYDEAVRRDQDCIAAILDLDAKRVAAAELCGKMPVLVLLELAHAKGWRPQLVDCKNSGDTAGDKNRVVGYAAIAFTEKEENTPMSHPPAAPTALDDTSKAALLKLARDTITSRLEKKPLPELPAGPELFREKLGCFVTLHSHGRLRGCIGHIFPQQPLAEAVRSNALSAAFGDPRFSPVELPEMAGIDIEISILTKPQPLVFKSPEDLLSQLRPGVDGVVLSMAGRRSTFLPQVWEQLPDKPAFLSQLAMKAGLAPDAWRDPRLSIELYQATVFGEK